VQRRVRCLRSLAQGSEQRRPLPESHLLREMRDVGNAEDFQGCPGACFQGPAVIPHNLRPLRPSDDAFVYGSWLGSLADELGIDRNDDKAFRDFKRMMRPSLAKILESKAVATTVARSRLDDDVLMGWVCSEPGVLHFVYVTKPWRRMGLATSLLSAAKLEPGAKATHYTSWGFPHVQRVIPGLEFDPGLLAVER
jgi:predicted RNA polymerase sigma factor